MNEIARKLDFSLRRLVSALIIIYFFAAPFASTYASGAVTEVFQEGKKAATRKLTGKIIDKNTKETLIGASVWLKDTSIGGTTDMDGNSAIGNLRNNSLKFLAEGLAANGIASLRFDKRGIGTSASAGKEEAKLRFEDYVNDVTGWIDYLAKEKRFTTITVAGHSEGALIGMLACQNRPKVKGYISVAGAGRPAYEIIEAQVAAQQNPEAVRKEVASINGSLKNGKEVSDVPAYLQSLYRASVQPYLISWFKYNPRTVIASVKVPVLIVQGKNDIQVSVEDAELLKKGCPAAELLLIDKMNHVLKDCESKAVQQQMLTYGNPSLPVNSTLIASVSTFVKKLK